MAPMPEDPRGYARCRKIFSALDGRDFMAANEHWRLEVFSVVQQAANLWIQLRLVGLGAPMVLTASPFEERRCSGGPSDPRGLAESSTDVPSLL